MPDILLQGRGALEEWREAARGLLLAGVDPRDVVWRVAGEGPPGLFEAAAPPPVPPPARTGAITVPRAFVDLADTVICHADPARFDLLYRLLVRLQDNRALLTVRADADVAQAARMEKSVRRDSHKMKAFVRFKELPGPAASGRRRFVAWFEPDHFIVARTAPFFQRRFTDMDWLILTPKGRAGWDGTRLEISDEAAEKPALDDATDELWRTYFSHIFNPARLKVGAMLSEMPKKYWKNLPEAALIPDLIATAEARVKDMIALAASQPPLRHERRRLPETAPAADGGGALPALAAEARRCTRCPLHCKATQTVFGEGPAGASLFFIGEQPGDREDLAGRPFVGPAGQIFDRTLAGAGIDRDTVYVTNAVKHFKYEPRGKLRLHKRPDSGEIAHCRWWLQKELEIVRPKVIVAMGATAVEGLTGERAAYARLKERIVSLDAGTRLLTTIHPSYLLRLKDESEKALESARFASAIARAAGLARDLAGTGAEP